MRSYTVELRADVSGYLTALRHAAFGARRIAAAAYRKAHGVRLRQMHTDYGRRLRCRRRRA